MEPSTFLQLMRDIYKLINLSENNPLAKMQYYFVLLYTLNKDLPIDMYYLVKDNIVKNYAINTIISLLKKSEREII